MQLFTIGGYGHTEETFVSRLKSNSIDLFVDIRARRGMRGRKYSFLNASRLQVALKEVNIAYLHLKNLAPSDDVRNAQRMADAESDYTKRSRERLSDTFISEYKSKVLQVVDRSEVLSLLADFDCVCLFCVESLPNACHRSIVTSWLEEETGPARHL